MQTLRKIALATSIMAVPIIFAVRAETYVPLPSSYWTSGAIVEGRSVSHGTSPADLARNPLNSYSGKIEGASPFNPEGSSRPSSN
jgi:hypothetical protein